MKNNRLRKLTAAVLTAALLLTLLPVMTVTGAGPEVWNEEEDTAWYEQNPGDSEFTITTAEQLAGLAKLVNGGNDFSGKTVRLGKDILLNDTTDWKSWNASTVGLHAWTPIGNFNARFKGVFDGQGHTVSGLHINTGEDYQGLFGIISGTVKNVGVTRSFIKGGNFVGGVVGNNVGTVTNCYYNTNAYDGNAVGTGNPVVGLPGGMPSGQTEAAMKALDFVEDADLDAAFMPDIMHTNDGFPVLKALFSHTFTGEGTDQKPYKISSPGELRDMAYLVNTDTANYSGAHYELTNDIDLGAAWTVDGSGGAVLDSGEAWTPIGTESAPFAGVFDGREFKVSGMYINTTLDLQGFFGYTDTAVIQNLTVSGFVYSYEGGAEGVNANPNPEAYQDSTAYHTDYIGGICGYGITTKFINCHNEASVYGEYYVGGICGRASMAAGAETGVFFGCTNSGRIVSTGEVVGGIVGKAANDYWDVAYVGEFIRDCVNSGEIVCTGTWDSIVLHNIAPDYEEEQSQCTGGIAGFVYGGSAGKGLIVNCTNSGSVTSAHAGTGGICGYICYGEIIDCHNTGAVTGTNDTGGVAGAAYGAHILSVSNTGEVRGTDDYDLGGLVGNLSLSTLENSWNSGSVTFYEIDDDVMVDGYPPYHFEGIGGLAGWCRASTIKNCYSSGAVTANFSVPWTVEGVGGAVGVMDSDTVAGNEVHSLVTNCYVRGNINGTSSYTGGLVGRQDSGAIENCYNTAAVSGSDYVGGVAGYNAGNGTIEGCYNTGAVNGNNSVGGVAGEDNGDTITGCYRYQFTVITAGGAAVDANDDSTGIHGGVVTASQLWTKGTYEGNGWGFDDSELPGPWFWDETLSYPKLNLGTEAYPFGFYVGGITAPLPIAHGEALALTPPAVNRGAEVTDEGWQISPDGTDDWEGYTDAALTLAHNGWYLRYYVTNSAGTSYSNLVQITVNKAVYKDTTATASVTYAPGLKVGDVPEISALIAAGYVFAEANTPLDCAASGQAFVGVRDSEEPDYTTERVTVTVTVNKASQASVSFTSADGVTYGTDLTLSVEGGTTGGAVSYGVTDGTGVATVTGGVLTPVKAGTVTVEAVMAGDANYDSVSASYVVTIAQKELTVLNTAVKNKTYDAQVAAEFVSDPALSGVVSNDAVDIKTGTGTPSFQTADAGNAITVSFTDFELDGADKDNYTLTQPEPVTADIAPLPVTVTPKTGQTKVYGEADPALEYDAVPALLGGDTFTGALTRDSGEDAGEYAITPGNLSAGANYAVTFTPDVKFTISRRDIANAFITITGPAVYTGAQLTPGFIITDSKTITANDYTVAYGENVNAGANGGRVTLTGKGNYTGELTEFFDILQATPTLTLSATPDNAERPNEVTLTAGSLPAGATGTLEFKAGVTAIATVTLPAASTTFAASGAADEYDFTVTYSGDNNYTGFTTAPLTYSFIKGTQAALTAGDMQTVYGTGVTLVSGGGSGTGAVSYSVVGGTGAGTVSGDAFTPTKAGTVTIEVKKAADDDYNPQTATFDVVIGPKQLAYTGLTADDKVYDGNAAAAVTGSLEGIVGNDVVDVIVTAAFADENAGGGKTVDVSFTLTGADKDNYTAPPSAAAAADITPKPITLTPAAGQSKVYGEADPVFAYGADPALLGSDGFTGALTRDSGENAGEYAITPGNLSAGANYALTFTPDVKFTIEKATPLIVTPPAASSVRRGGKLSGAALSGGAANVPGTFAWTDPDTVVNAAGEFEVTFTPDDTVNYEPFTLTVAVVATSASSGGASISISPPTASPKSGEVVINSAVLLSTTYADGKIYYTTDGTNPTQNSALYADPITVDKDMTVKAIVVSGDRISRTATFTYTVRAAKMSFKDKASETRYMKSHGDKFDPDMSITRYEMLTALSLLLDIEKADTDKTFSDVADEYKDLAALFAGAGIIDGFPDGTFGGTKGLTRAEFVKIMSIVLGLDIKAGTSNFDDMGGHWAESYVAEFEKLGYVKGYPGNRFMPDNEMTRAEFVAIVNRIIGTKTASVPPVFEDVPGSHWAYGDIMAVYVR